MATQLTLPLTDLHRCDWCDALALPDDIFCARHRQREDELLMGWEEDRDAQYEDAVEADMSNWLGSLFDEPELDDEFTAWYDAQFDEGGFYDRPGWEESRPSIQ